VRAAKETTLDPQSKFSRLWQGIVIIAVLFSAFSDPFFACFMLHETGNVAFRMPDLPKAWNALPAELQ